MLDLSSHLKVALFGAGRVGTAVSYLLAQAGHDVVGVASRSPASARAAARILRCPVFALDAPPRVDLLLLGVVDDALPEAVGALIRPPFPRVVVHFAGALGLAPLAPLLEAGAEGAALHPVQACPDFDTAIERLPGSAWGVTCSKEVTSFAFDLIARDLNGLPVVVPEEHRPVWHAAAAATSNGIAALLSFGERALDAIGVEDPERVLGPLAAGSVANARAGGGATLTGPVVRRDSGTIARQLRALEQGPGHLAAPYARITRLIVDEAEAAGRIDAREAEAMRALLGTA